MKGPRGARGAALVLALLAGCDARESAVVDATGASAPAAAAPKARGAVAPAAGDPRVAELRRLVELGAVAAARPLLAQLEARLGAEGPLLAARLAAAEGDAFGALREIERARREFPDDPGPYATAAEFYAALGRLPAAQAERDRGVALFGSTPELTRALGAIALATPGQARTGVEMLEKARREHPDLPFCDGPLAEGYLLLGRAALLRSEVAEALARADAGLALRPADPDLRQLRADGLAASGDLEGAIALLAALVDEGAAQADDLARLHHAAATAALVRKDRAGAIEHYLAARGLGWDDAALGFGAKVLAEEAARHVDAAREHLRRAELLRAAEAELGEGDDGADGSLADERAASLAAAEASLVVALRHAPDDLEAQDLLATVHFRAGRHAEAAAGWDAVWARMAEREGALPYPVHLNAARAWRLAGRPDRARRAVEVELARDPDSPSAKDARALLRRLDEEAAEAAAPPGGDAR